MTEIKQTGSLDLRSAKAAKDTAISYTDSSINDIQIGGRNLLLGTKDWSTVSYSATGTHSFDGTYNDCDVLKFIGSGSGNNDILFSNKHTVQIEADAYYVCSFWAKAADENTNILSYFYSPNVIDSTYNSDGYSSTNADGRSLLSIRTTWKRYWIVWHIKPDATTFPTTIIVARHNNSSGTLWIAGVKLEKGTKPTGWTQAPEEVDNKIDTTYDKIRSQGIQLVTNGNGFMGDNTNWPLLTFDGSKSNSSPGSFTKSAAQSEISSSELIPIDPSKEYLFEFDAMSSDETARMYSFLNFFDVDKHVISAQTVMYYYSTLTTLAQDLNPGDTTVKLTSAANWYSSSTAHQRSLIFWDYTNSYGYTYPPNTYSRNFYYNIYEDDSKVDKATGIITLKSAWTGPKKTAGTYVSQNHSGSSYNYAHTYVLVPATWTHFSFKYSGLDPFQDGNDAAGKFRQGTAFAKIGFLWNYGASTSDPQGQIWVTNVSLKEDTVTSSELSAVADAAAPKTTAIKRTQRIYYRSNSSTKPTTPGTASSNWVTQSGDIDATWTTMHVPITDTYKYIYTCEQSETNAGVVSYTTVLRDNTITVIDGGNIITGTVSANAIDADSINASNMLTIGSMTTSTREAIDNSKVVVGGRNLLRETPTAYSKNAYLAYNIPTTIALNELEVGDKMTVQLWGVEVDANSSGVCVFWGGGSRNVTPNSLKPDANGYLSYTFTVTEWMLSHAHAANKFVHIYNYVNGHSGSSLSIERWKLERGNKATDWTPAPEDIYTKTEVADTYAAKVDINGNNLLRGTNQLGTLFEMRSPVTWADGVSVVGSGTEGAGKSFIFELDDPPSPELRYGVRVEVYASGNKDAVWSRVPFEADTYTVSGWVRLSNTSVSSTYQIRIWNRTNDSQLFAWTGAATSSWERFAKTFTITEAQALKESNAMFGVMNAGSVEYCGLKCEKSAYATPWSASPEDTYTSQNIKPSILPLTNASLSSSYWTGSTNKTQYTELADGWFHFERDNSAGSNNLNHYLQPVVDITLKPGGQYTLLMEFKNVSASNISGGYFYTQQNSVAQVWGTGQYGGTAIYNRAIERLIDGRGEFRSLITLLDAENKDITGTVRGNATKTLFIALNHIINAGESMSYDIRISLYEGVYTGRYQPYSGRKLYATGNELTAVSTVANAAAPKATAIKRTQRIYYRSNSSTKPTTPGTASSNWVTQSGDVSSAWTTMHVPITNTYKYIYTCEQSETNAGVVGYTTVLRDNTITVIDGGNIITGTVSANAVNASSGTFDTANIPALTADHIKANVISAINGGTGTINADKINAANLSIGYSQITNPPTIPTQSSIDDAAKTATNYISAGANGIKISDSNPGSATTYQQLTSTSTEFITNGISTLYIGSESNVSIVRVGSSTKGNIVLSGDGYVDIRSGSNIVSHFGYESLYGEDDGTNPRVKSNYPYYTLGTRYTSNPSRSIGGFSVTLGKDCVAEEWCSIAMGYLAWANGYQSIALSGHASGNGSISMCPNSIASGLGSIAIGNSSQATSNYSVAIGHYAKATGSYSHAIGYYTEARGVRSIVGGDHSNAFADDSIAIGRYCKTESTANYSVALGYNSEAKSEYQTVIGKNNTFDTNGTYAFIIGGGSTSSARTNIFTVDWSGNVVCNNLTCNSINKVNDIVMIDREYPSSGSPSNSSTSLGTSIGGLYDRLYIEATDAAGNTKWIMLKGPFVNGTTYQFNIAITGVDKDVGLVFRTKTFSITTSTLNVVRNGNGDYKYGRATISNSGVSSWSYSNEVHITKVIGVHV